MKTKYASLLCATALFAGCAKFTTVYQTPLNKNPKMGPVLHLNSVVDTPIPTFDNYNGAEPPQKIDVSSLRDAASAKKQRKLYFEPGGFQHLDVKMTARLQSGLTAVTYP